MRRFVVERNAEHLDTVLLNRRVVVAERTGLFRAAGRVVLRVEIECDLLTSIVRKFYRAAVLVARLEIRGDVTLFQHMFSPLVLLNQSLMVALSPTAGAMGKVLRSVGASLRGRRIGAERRGRPPEGRPDRVDLKREEDLWNLV